MRPCNAHSGHHSILLLLLLLQLRGGVTIHLPVLTATRLRTGVAPCASELAPPFEGPSDVEVTPLTPVSASGNLELEPLPVAPTLHHLSTTPVDGALPLIDAFAAPDVGSELEPDAPPPSMNGVVTPSDLVPLSEAPPMEAADIAPLREAPLIEISPPPSQQEESAHGGEADAAAAPRLDELARFALPTLAIWLSAPLLSLIDTSVVGTVCDMSALAALGPSTKTCDYLAFFASVLGVATTNIAAERFGANDAAGATRVIASALTVAVVVGAAMGGALLLLATPIMTHMVGSASASAIGGAVQYTSIRALGYPAALATMVLQAGFLSCKDSRSPMLAIPLVALVNLLGDMLLVGPLGLGVAGAAWATIASQAANALVLGRLWRRKLVQIDVAQKLDEPAGTGAAAGAQRGVRRTSMFAVPTRGEMRRLAAFAAPMVLAVGARTYGGLSVAKSVAALGTASLAAHQVVECLYWLFAPFGEAVSLCVQAYMPALLCRSAAAAASTQRRVLRGSVALGAAVAASSLGLLVGVPHLFTNSAAVTATCATAAPLLAAALFGYVVSGVLEGALLARRQLRLLAASHVLNTVLLVGALRLVTRAPGVGLRHIWGLMALVNVARVCEFVPGLRRAEAVAARERQQVEGGERNLLFKIRSVATSKGAALNQTFIIPLGRKRFAQA